MPRTRRRFLEQVVGGAALSAAAPSLADAEILRAGSPTPPGSGRYDYLGRTPDYREWAVVPRGLTVKSIEHFRRESLALVRITASDGRSGWGQIARDEANISAEVLHSGLIVPLVVGRDISEIDAINDAAIDAQLKFPWSFSCVARWPVSTPRSGSSTVRSPANRWRSCSADRRGRSPVYGLSMRRDISPADEALGLARIRDQGRLQSLKIRLGNTRRPQSRRGAGTERGDHSGGAQGGGTEHRALCRCEQLLHPGRRHPHGGGPLRMRTTPRSKSRAWYWELEWTQEVTRALSIEVQGGEQDNDMAQRRRIITLRAVDIVQPDICYVRGPTRAWRVARMAQAAGLRDQAARGERLARHGVHDAPPRGPAESRRGRVFHRGRCGDHQAGQGDVRSRSGDEGWARRDAGWPRVGRPHQGRLADSRRAPAESRVVAEPTRGAGSEVRDI